MYRTAINTFRIKYNAIPGDMKDATTLWGTASACPGGTGAGTCNGNGDGSLGGNDEPFRAWQQLALSGMISGSYTGVSGPNTTFECDPGINVPASRVSGVGFMWVDTGNIQSGQVPYLFAGDYRNALETGAAPSHWDTIEPAFTAAEMFVIDTKIDDGRPGTGHVITRTTNLMPNCTNGDNTQGDTASYTPTTTGLACAFYYVHAW